MKVDPRVLRELKSVERACRVAKSARGKKRTEREEAVCLCSRTLYSTFVDRLQWSDGVNEHELLLVRAALLDCYRAIRVHADCAKSVYVRYHCFEQFVSKHADEIKKPQEMSQAA